MRSATITLATAATVACWRGVAQAFRPFDGTDAAVAETGKIEVEFGPIEYQREGAARSLFAPSTRINYGFAPAREIVMEGRVVHSLSDGVRGTGLVEDSATLKRVLRDGVLQDKGPSVATEFGVLLPGIRADRGTGATLAGILSQQWEGLTFHLNAAAALTRDQRADLFLGVIAEGPRDWPVRPIAELFYGRHFGESQTHFGLIGAIWQVSDDIAADIGLRGARVNERTACEIGAGVTIAFAVR